MRLDELLQRLDGVRPSGDGYAACCPAHDDRRQSLSVTEREGRILLKCHAGCGFEAIRDALGLQNADLRTNNRWSRAGGLGEILATYDYRDEGGKLLYQVVRFVPKDFRPRRPDGAGGWVYSMGDTRRMLYRPPELLAAPEATVYVCEGEKGVDRLRATGAIAVCSPGGAGKWKGKWQGQYTKPLRGRGVVVLPDNDPTGRAHGQDVARSLQGIASSVKVVELPGLEPKADIYDWLQDGHTLDELEALVLAAPEWQPGPQDSEQQAESPLPPAVRDWAHAETLASLWRDKYRWAAHRGRWMTWTGVRWAPVTDQQVAAQAASDLRADYGWRLATATAREDIERLAHAVTETCTYARIVGALSFLKGMGGFHTDADAWDADGWALNTLDGTVDLMTGKLRPHKAGDLLTRLAPVCFEAQAPSSGAWQEHLALFLPNENVRRQVQRDLGVALVGCELEEMLPVWYGTGANGKSTTARAIQGVLGDYAGQAAPGLLMQRKYETHPTEIADLFGRRPVFSAEVGTGARLDVDKVKKLTGGDRTKARFMREDFIEADKTWTLFLLCNHKPVIPDRTASMWRRVCLTPWTVTVPEERREPQELVLQRLLADGPAILRWLLEGLADWQRDRHWMADEVKVATAEYRMEQDRLAGFLGECCELRPYATVGVGELYDAYVRWCETAGEEPLGKKAFGDGLRDMGLHQVRQPHTRIRRWQGIRLTEGMGTNGDNDSVSRPREDESSRSPGNTVPICPQGGGDGERAKPTPSQQHYLELAELDEALHHG